VASSSFKNTPGGGIGAFGCTEINGVSTSWQATQVTLTNNVIQNNGFALGLGLSDPSCSCMPSDMLINGGGNNCAPAASCIADYYQMAPACAP
jgi:hypothetical protein